MIDKQIGDYKILQQIGSGGMAKVYLAVHKEIPNLQVVLKVLSDSRHAERFKQEADKLALLDSNPNICKIRHFFNHGDEFVIAMEHIDGPSLEEIITGEERKPLHHYLKIVIDILAALEPAHDQGIYHRDIKPSNIMFSSGGDLKIIDFGIAKGKTDPKLTIIGTAAGTPEYMAPEQFDAADDIDYARCDIYALGTILYRMLTGELPHKGDNEFAMRDSKLFEKPVSPSKLNGEIGKELDNLITRAIESDPDKRFASAKEMRNKLETIYAEYSDRGPETIEMRHPEGRRGSPGRKIFAIASAVIIIAAAVFIAIRILPGRNGRDDVKMATEDPVAVSDSLNEDTQSTPGGGSPSSSQNEGRGNASTGQDKTEDSRQAAADRSASSAPTTAVKRIVPGELLVGSVPRGADIYINGELKKEKTPYTFTGLAPGRYSVRIVIYADGQKNEKTYTVVLKSGEQEKILYKPGE